MPLSVRRLTRLSAAVLATMLAGGCAWWQGMEDKLIKDKPSAAQRAIIMEQPEEVASIAELLQTAEGQSARDEGGRRSEEGDEPSQTAAEQKGDSSGSDASALALDANTDGQSASASSAKSQASYSSTSADSTSEPSDQVASDSVASRPATQVAGASEAADQSQDHDQDEAGWNLETLQRLSDDDFINQVDLAEAWRLVVMNDPNYRAAVSAREAARTERQQGRAALLPQVQAGHSRNWIQGDREQPGPGGRRISQELDYDSKTTYVQVQQPLINFGRYADYRRGVARAAQGVAEFAAREQEIGLRLAGAYFDVLQAHESLRLTQSLAESLAGQAEAQDELYRLSEGSSIDAQETRARLAIAAADVIAAEDDFQVALSNLDALLGVMPASLAGLRTDFPLPGIVPSSLAAWLERARVNNANIRLAREAVRVADAEVDRAVSRFLPSMDLVASWSDADSENIDVLSQQTNTYVVGVQVSIPIFSGGYNSANRAQAHAFRRQAAAQLNAEEELTAAEVTRQYSAVLAGESRIRALRTAVRSAQLNMEGALKGYEYGVISNTDVLRAQDNLFQARHDLIRAKLDYLYARTALAAAVGELNAPVFDQIASVYLGPDVPLPGVVKVEDYASTAKEDGRG